jgi:hypothetical protein
LIFRPFFTSSYLLNLILAGPFTIRAPSPAFFKARSAFRFRVKVVPTRPLPNLMIYTPLGTFKVPLLPPFDFELFPPIFKFSPSPSWQRQWPMNQHRHYHSRYQDQGANERKADS